MADFQIGPFGFVDLKSPPDFTKQSVMIEERAGVDGTLLKTMGRRGQPRRWISLVDVPTLYVAVELYDYYLALVGANPVPVKWAGIELSGQLFAVLDVQPITMDAAIWTVGGLTANSLAVLECEWTLLPIRV